MFGFPSGPVFHEHVSYISNITPFSNKIKFIKQKNHITWSRKRSLEGDDSVLTARRDFFFFQFPAHFLRSPLSLSRHSSGHSAKRQIKGACFRICTDIQSNFKLSSCRNFTKYYWRRETVRKQSWKMRKKFLHGELREPACYAQSLNQWGVRKKTNWDERGVRKKSIIGRSMMPRRQKKWWSLGDSNSRPNPCEGCVLTNWTKRPENCK